MSAKKVAQFVLTMDGDSVLISTFQSSLDDALSNAGYNITSSPLYYKEFELTTTDEDIKLEFTGYVTSSYPNGEGLNICITCDLKLINYNY